MELIAPHKMKLALYVLGSFAFGYNAANILHECGHLLSGILSGGRALGLTSHPFSWSMARVADCRHPQFMTWGGILWSGLLGLIIFIFSYPSRSIVLFPILLTSSLLILVNGVYFTTGTLIRAGDPADLMEYGVGAPVLLVIGCACLLAGSYAAFMSVCVLRPFVDSAAGMIQVLAIPVTVYLLGLVLYHLLQNTSELVFWRSAASVGIALVFVLSVLVARYGARFQPPNPMGLTWNAVAIMNLLAGSLIVAQLTIFSSNYLIKGVRGN
jgi:hypothetical protein